MAFLEAPVMRTVARMELPSTRAAMTWACLAGVRRFMVLKNTSELGSGYGIEPEMSRNKIDKHNLILIKYVPEVKYEPLHCGSKRPDISLLRESKLLKTNWLGGKGLPKRLGWLEI